MDSGQWAVDSKNGITKPREPVELPTSSLSTAHCPLSTAPAEPVLRFERVSKWYGPVIGVNQVSLELRTGITGLVGANGAGKSTLLRLAAGHLRPDLGAVAVCGREISPE